MKPIMLTALTAALLLSGCAAKNAGPDGNADNRMNDPSILQHDPELRIGDLGIGQPAANDGRFHSLQEQEIPPRVHPNPSIARMGSNYAQNVISFGSIFLGTPYEYGSDRNDPSTFDCSDFTRWAFLGSLGMDIPKDSRSQALYVSTYSPWVYTDPHAAKPGDLLFFMDYRGPRIEDYQNIDPGRESITHVGIYLGSGNILHTASKATGGVRIDYMFGKHLEWRFIKGGSILP